MTDIAVVEQPHLILYFGYMLHATNRSSHRTSRKNALTIPQLLPEDLGCLHFISVCKHSAGVSL